MAQYLVAIHHPDDYDPSVAEDELASVRQGSQIEGDAK